MAGEINERAVRERLLMLGYGVKKENIPLIKASIARVEMDIRSGCNTTGIPEELSLRAVDMACGEFLLILMQSGQLEDSFDTDAALKTVQTGDTTVTFMESQDVAGRFDSLISWLMRGKGEYVRYRKLRW